MTDHIREGEEEWRRRSACFPSWELPAGRLQCATAYAGLSGTTTTTTMVMMMMMMVVVVVVVEVEDELLFFSIPLSRVFLSLLLFFLFFSLLLLLLIEYPVCCFLFHSLIWFLAHFLFCLLLLLFVFDVARYFHDPCVHHQVQGDLHTVALSFFLFLFLIFFFRLSCVDIVGIRDALHTPSLCSCSFSVFVTFIIIAFILIHILCDLDVARYLYDSCLRHRVPGRSSHCRSLFLLVLLLCARLPSL